MLEKSMDEFLLGSIHEGYNTEKKNSPWIEQLPRSPIWVCVLLFAFDCQPCPALPSWSQ